MALLEVVGRVVAGVLAMVVTAALLIVGPARLHATARTLKPRLRAVAPSLGMLAVVLLANGVVRDVGVDISWLIGVNITDYIFALEGQFVAHLQSFATPELTAYFSFVYVYGYAFLLFFPLVGYLALEETHTVSEIAFAYVINYSVGLLCYVLFVAYGPRNLMPEMVESLLYTSYPQYQFLTSEVNRNTNVFPSLHASLATTVAVLAYRTRHVYPRWLPLAVALAASVAVATMYLGIHWATDVVAGIVLGWGSVHLAVRVVDRRTARLVDAHRNAS